MQAVRQQSGGRIPLQTGSFIFTASVTDSFGCVALSAETLAVTCPTATATVDRIVPIDLQATLQPSNPPLASLLATPTS